MSVTAARHGVRAVVIYGPTASGKSALAAALARRLRGAVVNADALQLYRDLPVITAQPEPSLQAKAPHHLYGVLDWRRRASAGWWNRRLGPLLDELWAAGRLPILVGGTGLYLRAALLGLAPVPPVREEITAALRAELAAKGVEHLHDVLARVDPPLAARVSVHDRQRILRALAVWRSTGRRLSDWQRQACEDAALGRAAAAGRVAGIVLQPAREMLYRRIDARFAAMMDQGALEEVEALIRADLDPELPVMKAIGVRPLMRYLKGACTREEAVAEGRRESRRYAKRQLTWARHQFRGWTGLEIPPDVADPAALSDALIAHLEPAAAQLSRWVQASGGGEKRA